MQGEQAAGGAGTADERGGVPVGSVVLIAVATLVHMTWWWVTKLDWDFDYQGTYDGLHDELADPWFWSVEALCAGVVVLVAGLSLRGVRRRSLVANLVVPVAAVLALAQMASIRLLLPSRAECDLPDETVAEVAVVDAARWRAVGLAILLIVAASAIGSREGRRRTP